MNDHQTYKLDRFPAWKLNVWHQISTDAKERGAFATEDFECGCVIPYIKAYQGLYRWLAAIDSPFAFETLQPLWEHNGDGEWRLLLVEREDWVRVKGWGNDKAVCAKPVKIRRPGRGGLVVQGVRPENGVGDDWVVVDHDEVPSVEDIPENMFGVRKSWWQFW